MYKTNILQTPITRAFNLEQLSKEAARFIQTNKTSTDLSPDDYEAMVANVNPMLKSHINNFFHNLVEHDKLSSIYFFSYLKNMTKGLPELLTKDDICVDGAQLNMSVSSEFRKAWVNLSPTLSISKDRVGAVHVSDIPKLVSTVVRSFLCMSYNDMKEWLSPKMSVFVIEFYTMTMSHALNRAYNLDFEEDSLVKLLFAWYYSGLLGETDKRADHPVLLRKLDKVFKGVQSARMLEEQIERVNEVRDGREMSIDVICDILRKIGPKRMQKLTGGHVYRMMSISSVDNNALLIGIDYPPYFVHQILSTASGAKHPVLSRVLDTKFNKQQVAKTLEQFVNNTNLFKGVNRK